MRDSDCCSRSLYFWQFVGALSTSSRGGVICFTTGSRYCLLVPPSWPSLGESVFLPGHSARGKGWVEDDLCPDYAAQETSICSCFLFHHMGWTGPYVSFASNFFYQNQGISQERKPFRPLHFEILTRPHCMSRGILFKSEISHASHTLL